MNFSLHSFFNTWLKPPALCIAQNRFQSQTWMAVLLPVFFLLPFLGKALNVDDPLFVWSAQQILKEPFDFYGFQVNWYGFALDRADIVNQNPPGVAYYLALFGFLFGWSEYVLHAAMLFPAAAVGLGCYRLAQQFCHHPLVALLINVFCPVFLVSASTLMSDVLMLAFYVWAVVWWIRGLEQGHGWWLVLAALLVVLATLTKYFGITLFLLLGFYAGICRYRLGFWLPRLLLAMFPIIAFEFYAHHLYGHGLISSAIDYLTEFGAGNKTGASSGIIGRSLSGLLFLGGCFLAPIFFLNHLWSSTGIRIISIILSFFLLFLILSLYLNFNAGDGKNEEYFFLIYFIHFAIFLIAGAHILFLVLLDLYQYNDAKAWLLFVWVLGVVTFAIFFNWTINGRGLLPMLPVMGILVARRLEIQGAKSTRIWHWAMIPTVLAGVMALTVMTQDQSWANSVRATSQRLTEEYGRNPDKNLWFQGTWGFQYYMQQHGAEKISRDNASRIKAGDFYVISIYSNTFTNPKGKLGIDMKKVDDWRVLVSRIGTTMNGQKNAGFYSNIWGSFPYFFGYTEDLYLIYRVEYHD